MTFCHFVKVSLITWPTACEWYCTFCEMLPCHIITNSKWVHCSFMKGSLITSFSMTISEWVAFHILWMAVSSHFFLWPTASEWQCTKFYERKSHHHDIISYAQQQVSDIAHIHIVKASFLTSSFPITNRKWVIFPFCESQLHHIYYMTHRLWVPVTLHVFWSYITSFPLTNSLWVTLHSQNTSAYLNPWMFDTLHPMNVRKWA